MTKMEGPSRGRWILRCVLLKTCGFTELAIAAFFCEVLNRLFEDEVPNRE